MAVKTITIKEKVFEKIKRMKRGSESFSDLFERLVEERKPDIMKYAGIITDKEAEEIMKVIKEHRKSFNADVKKRRRKIAQQLGKKGKAE